MNEVLWQVELIEERTAMGGGAQRFFFNVNELNWENVDVFMHGLGYDLLQSMRDFSPLR